jgi:uncharacterized protein (TIGR02231 family)
MKKAILLFGVISLFSFSVALAVNQDENKIQSKIKHITVYTQNAKISCDATARVSQGVSNIIIENLPSTIDGNSIQVKLTGEVRILSVSYRINYLSEVEKSKEYKALKDTLDRLSYDLQSVKNQISIYQGEETLITQNNKLGGDKGFTTVELQSLADFYRKRVGEIKSEIQKSQLKQSKLVEKIQKIQNQLNVLNELKNKPTGEIVIEVGTNNALTTNIDFSYITSGVRWSPVYDLKSEGIDKPVELVYKANVMQNTGFDWNNVKLIISTGNPTADNSRPILNPRYVSFYTPPVLGYDKSESKRKAEPAANMAMEYEDAPLAKMSMEPQIVVNENQLNVEWEIDVPYNIPSDNLAHIVEMKKTTVPATYQYHTVPVLDNGAFLLAKVTDWGKLNLLPGNANLFFDGSYIGQSYIDPYNVSDTLLLSFGRDEKIKVKREKLLDLSSMKLVGANKKQTMAYEINIRNTKSTPISIDVLDQIPLTTTTEIEVELLESAGASYLKELGKLNWKVELKPNETRKIKFVYSVKYPKDKVIVGY